MPATGQTALILYSSAVTGHIPSAGNLYSGELAINTADGKLYYKNSNTNAVELLATATTANPVQINQTQVLTAPSATNSFYINSQSSVYYASNSTVDFTFDVAAGPSATLNSYLANNQSCTIDIYVANGATPHALTDLLIDGVSQTVLWDGGVTPTGEASAVDQYTFTIVKSASATYTVFGAYSFHA